MKKRRFAIAAPAALWLALAPAWAQETAPRGQLSINRLADIRPGAYLAGETLQFDLVGAGKNYLLRFKDSPEVFVLYADHAPLGGRILKYDSGETALNVSGWGGMTVYTDAAPQGLPAMRTGDAPAPQPPSISVPDMQSAADDEAERLVYVRRLEMRFVADWNALGDNFNLRAFAFDTMENAARGIERFTGAGTARNAFAKRISIVAIRPAARPGVELNGRTLVVAFNPDRGFAGRASSRAIARALVKLLLH